LAADEVPQSDRRQRVSEELLRRAHYRDSPWQYSALAMQPEDFAFELIRASKAMGSLSDVATLLEVEPRQIYRWIADLERPSAERLAEMHARLRSVSAAPFTGR
jgi:hypothetical protein